ncbi:MAG TPA: TetR/AcrR family transcriptional regulator [Anaerolineae bacterium]
MRDQSHNRGVYTTHRQNQRQAILDSAEELFGRMGIDAVTMSQVASAAHMTRATLYQYFSNKQEIAWAIFESVIAQWRSDLEREVLPNPGSGCDKLERFLYSALDFAIHDPRQAGFLAQFNVLYARERFNGRMSEAFAQGFGNGGNFMLTLIQDGIVDGSLRPDIDPMVAASAMLNFTAAIQLRLGLLGTLVEAEYGMSSETIFRQMVRIFIDGLRAHPEPLGSRPISTDVALAV